MPATNSLYIQLRECVPYRAQRGREAGRGKGRGGESSTQRRYEKNTFTNSVIESRTSCCLHHRTDFIAVITYFLYNTLISEPVTVRFLWLCLSFHVPDVHSRTCNTATVYTHVYKFVKCLLASVVMFVVHVLMRTMRYLYIIMFISISRLYRILCPSIPLLAFIGLCKMRRAVSHWMCVSKERLVTISMLWALWFLRRRRKVIQLCP